MIINSTNLEDHTILQADIGIIGGGAAGITLALELSKQENLNICLLESGGLEFDSKIQKLYDEENEGTLLNNESHYLYQSRQRFLGGSTNHWAGYLRPLEPIDFKKRDWLAFSGWPFRFKELKPYYQRALTYFGISGFNDLPETPKSSSFNSKKKYNSENLMTDSSLFTTKYFHVAKKLRFNRHFRRKLKNKHNLKLILNMNAVEIHPAEETSSIEQIKAVSLTKKELRLKAKYFVIAAGGIENARLLLYSKEVGLRHLNDLTGRFFMEHPHIPAGTLFLTQKRHLLSLYARHYQKKLNHFASAALFPTEKAMRENYLLNMNIQLVKKFVRIEKGSIKDHSKDLGDQRYPLLHKKYRNFSYAYLKVRTEQSPNLESRVVLSTSKNSLGYPKSHLKWYLTNQDKESVRKNLLLLAKEFGRLGLGRLKSSMEDLKGGWPDFTYGGSHHLGTTRMSLNPKKGVVDSNLKFQGYQNLFILGSSVFPTGGGVNPTFTILALTIRLADLIKSLVK